MYLQQGTNCKWILNGVEFLSDESLHSALETQLKSSSVLRSGEGHAIFSLDLQNHAKDVLNDIKINVEENAIKRIRTLEDPDETETYLELPGSIGSTRFLGKFGHRDNLSHKGIVTPFDEARWKSIERNKFSNEEEANKAFDQQLNVLFPELSKYGDDVHAVLESVFKDEEFNKSTKLTTDQINQIRTWGKQLKSKFQEKYGKNAKFYTEFAFKSKDLHPIIKTALESQGLNSINGRADLIVLDEAGRIHIFDFKVSRKSVGQWRLTDNSLIAKRNWKDNTLLSEGEWSSSKKFSATNQLALYTAILRQHGLNVASAEIIPIKLDFEYKSEFEIDHLENIQFPKDTIILPEATSGDSFQHIASEIIPISHQPLNSTLDYIFSQYKLIFPGINVTTNVSRKESTVEWYIKNNKVHKVKSTDPHYPENEFVFYKSIGKKYEPVYAKNEEDLREKLSQYVQELNDVKSREVLDLANLIKNEMFSDDFTLQNIVGNLPARNHSIYIDQIKKYIQQGWTLEGDDSLLSAGIFIFSNGNEVEVLTLTNSPLYEENNLGVGTTILGATTRNKNVGSTQILSASNGHLELMKAMFYIAENQDWFKGKKITQIRALNPWHGQVLESVMNEQLLYNYQAIQLRYKDLKNIDPSIFSDDFTSLYKLSTSKLYFIDKTIVDFDVEQFDINQVESRKNWVIQTRKQLFDKYKEKLSNPATYSITDEIWQAYNFLGRILMSLNGLSVKSELDKGPWMQGKLSPTGLLVASPQQSPSVNMREFAKLHDRYVAEVRQMQQKMGFEFQKALKEMYQKEGHGNDIYELMFEKDANGITNQFRLKDPEDPEFHGKPHVKKVMTLFLETMWKLRFPDATETDKIREKNSGVYYEVPLTEAIFRRQTKNLGFITAVKNKINQYKELTEDVFAGDANIKERFEKENDCLYNKFALDPNTRESKISQHGVGFFETNLEIVFNQALVAYTKQKISEKYVPIFRAMQLGLRHEDEYGHGGTPINPKMQEIRSAIDKFIDNRFFGKPIMNEKLLPYYRWLSVASHFFSTIKLGLNVRSFLREILNGVYIGTTRLMSKQMEGVDFESYNKAITYILQDLPNNMSGISKIQQLNAIYGMANYSLGNIANNRRVDWLNIHNWDSSTLFIGCSAPDYQHRMAILMAKMIKDGCWDAYELNENDELVYNFKKDKRFEVYLSDNKSHPKYLDQKALYLKNLEEWNAQGYVKPDGTSLVEGDDLPQAYTNREGQSVKNYADLLYGHYDDESRGLLNDMFLGSFFMQFKTFITAKLEQWTMREGIYNIEHLKQQLDPITNEKLYSIITYPENKLGLPVKEIIRESELKNRSQEEQDRAHPYIEWTGQPMEGMAHGLISLAKTLNDPKKIIEKWNDPHERGLLLLGINDMFVMSLMGLIIKLLYGAVLGSDDLSAVSKDVRNAGYLTSLTYNIFRGVTGDAPLHNIIFSMTSDVNPPLITNIAQLANSTNSVLFGDSSLAYALTRNIGLISDFSGIVKQWEETNK